jgi:hypothetical protein
MGSNDSLNERTPLLRVAAEEAPDFRPPVARKVTGDVIDFDPQGDVDNPQEWPRSLKWTIVMLLTLMAFITYVLHGFVFVLNCAPIGYPSS